MAGSRDRPSAKEAKGLLLCTQWSDAESAVATLVELDKTLLCNEWPVAVVDDILTSYRGFDVFTRPLSHLYIHFYPLFFLPRQSQCMYH